MKSGNMRISNLLLREFCREKEKYWDIIDSKDYNLFTAFDFHQS